MGEADYRSKLVARARDVAVASVVVTEPSPGAAAIDFALKLQHVSLHQLSSDHWPSHAGAAAVQAEISKQVGDTRL
jgi:hypothetical protein